VQQVIFLCLIFSVSLLYTNQLIDLNLSLRFTLFSALGLGLVAFLPRVKMDVIAWGLFAFYVINISSALWALSPSEAMFESQRVFYYLIAYIIARHFVQHHTEFTAKSIIALSSILLAVNIVWWAGSQFFETTFASTSAHKNLLSSYLFLLGVIQYAFYHQTPHTWRLWSKVNILLSGIFILVLGTRSVILASLFIAYLVFSKHIWNNLKSWKWTVVATPILLILALGALIAYRPSLFHADSLFERFFVWGKTASLIKDNFFLGVGAGNWELTYTKYGIGGFDTLDIYGTKIQRPHNDFLWVMAETGLLGSLLLLTIVWLVIQSAWQNRSHREISRSLMGLVSFGIVAFFSFPKERIEHIWMLSLLISIAASRMELKPTLISKSFRPMLLLILAFSAIVGAYRIQGEYHSKNLLMASNDKMYDVVLSEADKAESVFYQILPGGVPIASYRAEAYLKTGNETLFQQQSTDAFRLAPYNYEVLSNYGMALNASRQLDSAYAVLNTAHEINPRYDGAMLNLAIVCYNQQKYSEAKSWIDSIHFKSEITDHYGSLISQKLQEKSE